MSGVDDPRTNQPDFKNSAYMTMAPGWTIVDDVVGGTMMMRRRARTYLPQELAEPTPKYESRLNRSVFFNTYVRIRDALVGMIFKTNPELMDIPPAMADDIENIDLAGTHFDVFAKELFMDSFEGHVFILVDMQSGLPEGSTLADEKAAGLRPYWVKYHASQALNWRVGDVEGETVLTQITFEEKTLEPSGLFGEVEVTRYRVFRLESSQVTWELYRRVSMEGSTESQIVLDQSGTLSIDRIPVVVVYGNRVGPLQSSPPLLDLAYLNIAHWQE